MIFIFLGVEMLISVFSKHSEDAKIDIPSCIMTFVLMGFSMVMAALQFVVEAFPQYVEMYI